MFLVSHDRTFLDNVVTSTIAFEGNGLWREYEGGVQDWLIQSKRSRAISMAAGASTINTRTAASKSESTANSVSPQKPVSARKLNHKEQRELDSLPTKLAQLEQEQVTLRAELNDVNLYTKDPLKAGKLYQRDAAIEDEMLSLLARWEALSEV